MSERDKIINRLTKCRTKGEQMDVMDELILYDRELARISLENENRLKNKPEFHGEFSEMTEEVKDSIINPKHYKIFSPEDYADYPDGIEYMDLCEKVLAHLSGVTAHLVGQILKYALRLGKKDSMEQDATKIEWYAVRLVKWVKKQNEK